MALRPSEWRIVFWDRSVWWRTYREGGFDGYRTLLGRKLPCYTMYQATTRPDLRDEIRPLSLPKRKMRKRC